MKKLLSIYILLLALSLQAQTNPAITKWLQNTTTFGRYYSSGNSTPIVMTVLANCQQVRYSSDWVYINATGIPAYPVGIFTGDGNPNNAGNQNAIYKIPLNPVQNTGTPTATSLGNIGVFINGVSLFDYKDGVAWNKNTNALCGGPGNSPCPGGPSATQAWNRDAIPAEKTGFDCAKGHPAGTNYHHHQNPSAFKYDTPNTISYSTICSLYDSEGLYTINDSQHAPLIGFSYDGFPIYGAYGYTNVNGTGPIARMKSGYQLSTNSTRANGPAVSSTYFNGYFKEDYVYVAHPTDPTYLDEHNGRFCITPEYPAGIYCYFATVNADKSSAFPYIIGPTYYGNVTGKNVTAVTETTSTYINNLANDSFTLNESKFTVFPNPSKDIITIQLDFAETDLNVDLINLVGKVIKSSKIFQGTTMSVFEIDDVYNGIYFVKIYNDKNSVTKKIIIKK